MVLDAAYDAVGNRMQLKATIVGTADFQNDYTFDTLRRMTRVQQTSQTGGNAVADKRVDLAYNAAGQFTQIDRYEDLAATQLVASSSYGYDTVGRLNSLSHDKGANNLASYTWTFDAANRITQMTTVDGTVNYTYDKTHQLLSATYGGSQADESYSFDANGNRNMAGHVVGTDNRLLSDGASDYEYDANANRTKKTDQATGDYVDYTWDHRNRLVKAAFRTSGGALTREVRLTYNALDRLVRKEVDDDGNGTIDREERYVYDGGDLVAVYDGNSSLRNRYLHALDRVFASEDALGEVLWPLGDHQQTVRDLADYDAGADTTIVANHRQFGSFGGVTGESNAAVNHRFAFTGQLLDEDLGLQLHGLRWYDPSTGRWMSNDPIGFAGGDANLQRYVSNSPVNFVDPTGLFLFGPRDGAAGGPKPAVKPPPKGDKPFIFDPDKIFDGKPAFRFDINPQTDRFEYDTPFGDASHRDPSTITPGEYGDALRDRIRRRLEQYAREAEQLQLQGKEPEPLDPLDLIKDAMKDAAEDVLDPKFRLSEPGVVLGGIGYLGYLAWYYDRYGMLPKIELPEVEKSYKILDHELKFSGTGGFDPQDGPYATGGISLDLKIHPKLPPVQLNFNATVSEKGRPTWEGSANFSLER